MTGHTLALNSLAIAGSIKEAIAERDRLREINTELLEAGRQCLLALLVQESLVGSYVREITPKEMTALEIAEKMMIAAIVKATGGAS